MLVLSPLLSFYFGFYLNNIQISLGGVPARGAYRAPIIRMIPDDDGDYVVREGDKVRFLCKAAGHPKPTIKWTITGGSLFRRNLDLRSENLKIPNIKRTEATRITCRARNGIGNVATMTKRINVLYLDKPTLILHLSGKGPTPNPTIWKENKIHFACEVISNPAATFTWWKDGKQIYTNSRKGYWILRAPPYKENESMETLTVSNVMKSDMGTYECRTFIGRQYGIPGTSVNFTYKFNMAPPRIKLLSPVKIIVNPREKIQIRCDAIGGFPPPTLTWMRKDGVTTNRMIVQRHKSRNILIINNAAYSDSGDYFCVGYNKVELAVEKKATVIVRRLTSMIYWLTPDPRKDDRRLAAGYDVKLTCYAEAVPATEIQYSWFKVDSLGNNVTIYNNSQIKNMVISSRTKIETRRGITFPAYSSFLDVNPLTNEDFGVYVCSAILNGNPTMGNVSSRIAITKDSAPPRIKAPQTKISVIEGEPATLQCNAIRQPNSLIQFYRNENQTMPSGKMEEIAQGGRFVIQKVNKEDAGDYLCSAALYNGFSKVSKKMSESWFNLEVNYPPVVEPSYKELRKPLGSEVTLSCFVIDAMPRDLTSNWTKYGKLYGNLRSSQQFLLPSIQTEDYGVYNCTVANSVGIGTCVVQLSNKPYAPEFLYRDFLSNDSFPSSQQPGANVGIFIYSLVWTQKLPGAVDPINRYRIRWRRHSTTKDGTNIWLGEDMTLVRGMLYFGQLLTHDIKNLMSGMYEVEVTAYSDFAEGDPGRRFIQVGYPTEEFFCAFEKEDLCKFEQDTKEELDWTLNNQNMLLRRTPGTGPDRDHTTFVAQGGYMFVETSNAKQGQKARLISPTFQENAATAICLKFYYHMKGQHIGTLHVLVKVIGGGKAKEVWRKEGEQGDNWISALINMHPSSHFQVIFEAITTGGYQGDIAIDDVILAEEACPAGSTTTASFKTASYGGGSTSIHMPRMEFKLFGYLGRQRSLVVVPFINCACMMVYVIISKFVYA